MHGKNAAANALSVSGVLFGGKSISELSRDEKASLIAEAPKLLLSPAKLMARYTVVEALVESNLSSSKGDARRLIDGKGVSLNDEVVENSDLTLEASLFSDGLALLRRGKQVVVLSIEK